MTAWDALDVANRIEIPVTRVQFDPGNPLGVALAHPARSRGPGVRVLLVAQAGFADDVAGFGLLLPRPVGVPEVADAVPRMLAYDKAGRM